MNFGLERIHHLLDTLHRPDERTHIVHVAGTNGKGSVCAYIASVLLTCGYTVGRFNSPHLLEPRDSINVNGEAVSQELYEEAVSFVNDLNKKESIGASSFECLVASAFYVFDKAKVDFVVLEVGLGGLLDATNAIQHPVMTVITSIGLDHAHILGNTVQEIAAAKAGIMKRASPVVIAPQDSGTVVKTLVDHADKKGSPYTLVQPSQMTAQNTLQLDLGHIQYTYSIQLVGDYQCMNSATAVTALDWMRRLGTIQMTKEQLALGMKRTCWPGRLDWVKDPWLHSHYGLDQVLVDGAHNPPAAIALRRYVDSLGKGSVLWIIGSTAGKDIGDMLKTLVREEDSVFAVPFTQPKGMPWIQSTSTSDIAQQAQHARRVECCQDLNEALTKAGSNRNECVVVCGSLYLVADLYREIKAHQAS